MRNNLRFLSRVIYNLKRDYGEPTDFYKRTSSTYDVSTGVKSVGLAKVRVNRAVVLPQDLARKFLYDAVFLKQDRPFAYGAFFSAGDRTVLVDRKDLPRDWEIELSDYLIIKDRRYEVKNVDEFEGGFTYLLQVTELKGQQKAKIIDKVIKQNLTFRQQVLLTPKTNTSIFQNLVFVEQVSLGKKINKSIQETLIFNQNIAIPQKLNLSVTQTLIFNESTSLTGFSLTGDDLITDLTADDNSTPLTGN